MRLRTSALVTVFAAVVATAPLLAQTPQAPAAPAKAADTAPTLAGKWTISLDTPQGAIDVSTTLKLDGKKIGGTLTGPTGQDTEVTGELADGKITFSISPEGNTFTFVGTQKDADHMTGSLTSPMGEIPWTATRVKG